MAALERGLTMPDVRRMTIAQIVDFTIDYNVRQQRSEQQSRRPRQATQADIDAFLG